MRSEANCLVLTSGDFQMLENILHDMPLEMKCGLCGCHVFSIFCSFADSRVKVACSKCETPVEFLHCPIVREDEPVKAI